MAKKYISTDRLRQVFRHENPEEIINYLKDRHHKLAHKNSWELSAVRELVKAGYKVAPTYFRGQVWRYQDYYFIINLSGAVSLNSPRLNTDGWKHAGAHCQAMGFSGWLGVMKDVYGETRFIYGWRNTDKGVEVYTDMGPMYPDDKDVLHYQL